MQGMRRSRTTILYDALLEDPGLHSYSRAAHPARTPRLPVAAAAPRRDRPPSRRRERCGAPTATSLARPRPRRVQPRRPRPPTARSARRCRDSRRHLPRDPASSARSRVNCCNQETRLTTSSRRSAEWRPRTPCSSDVVRDPRAVAASMMTGKSRSRDLRVRREFFAERESRKLVEPGKAHGRDLLQRTRVRARAPAGELRADPARLEAHLREHQSEGGSVRRPLRAAPQRGASRRPGRRDRPRL